jgi:hypothetical protein
MPDWQERISRQTHPAARVEHELRYAAVAPLLEDTRVWCVLGCATGVGALASLPRFEGRMVLVDADEDSVALGRDEVDAAEIVSVVADLERPEDLQRVRAALDAQAAQDTLVTCFGVFERLSQFTPLGTALVELAAAGATVVISVANHAFSPEERGEGDASWGAGAFDELRRLLPADTTLAHQVALHGSCLVPPGDLEPISHRSTFTVGGHAVPTHYVAAFGRRAGELALSVERVVETDRTAERRWAAQRESDLAYYQALNRELESARAELERLRGTGEAREDDSPGASVLTLPGPDAPARRS